VAPFSHLPSASCGQKCCRVWAMGGGHERLTGLVPSAFLGAALVAGCSAAAAELGGAPGRPDMLQLRDEQVMQLRALQEMLGLRRTLKPTGRDPCLEGYQGLDGSVRCKPKPLPPPQRGAPCHPVGTTCWINAQCCSARCMGIHTCGVPVGGCSR